jgi:hypothetical protein
VLNRALPFGLLAGLIAGVGLSASVFVMQHNSPPAWSMAVGYALMLIALSTVFVAIKRRRDRDLGGVIRFWPAFGLGLVISLIAGVIYALTWEAALAVTGYDFAAQYGASLIERERAAGATATRIAELTAEMKTFETQYANPLFRLPMTFVEIFPVGVLVSLVSAALLRNSRFMPARSA